MIEIVSPETIKTLLDSIHHRRSAISKSPQTKSCNENPDCAIKINKSISQSFNLQSLLSSNSKKAINKKTVINVVTFYWHLSITNKKREYVHRKLIKIAFDRKDMTTMDWVSEWLETRLTIAFISFMRALNFYPEKRLEEEFLWWKRKLVVCAKSACYASYQNIDG